MTITSAVVPAQRGLQSVQRTLSFCRRHRLPVSLLGLSLDELTRIQADIGRDRHERLLHNLQQQVLSRIRCEDALIDQAGHHLHILLPATCAKGALTLAQRLMEWLEQQEFHVDDFQVSLPATLALHSLTCLKGVTTEALFLDLKQTFKSSSPEDRILISPAARKQLDSGLDLSTQDNVSRSLLDLLRQGGADALLTSLGPALGGLDETERLRLVDLLLEASIRPESTLGFARH